MPTFSVKELTEICIKIIRKMGADEETSNIVANNLVKANLTGHDSHGVIYIPRLLERIPDKINPKAKPVIKQKKVKEYSWKEIALYTIGNLLCLTVIGYYLWFK